MSAANNKEEINGKIITSTLAQDDGEALAHAAARRRNAKKLKKQRRAATSPYLLL